MERNTAGSYQRYRTVRLPDAALNVSRWSQETYVPVAE